MFFSPSLDGCNAEKVDFWGHAFAFGGFRGVPHWNHKMLQSHGFAVTTMLGAVLFLQASNSVAYVLNQYKLGGQECSSLKAPCTARRVPACIPSVTKCFSCRWTLALTSSTGMTYIPEYSVYPFLLGKMA